MSAIDIYDLETPVEIAFQNICVAGGLVCFTSSDAPDLQRARPRVEVMLIVGSARNQWTIITPGRWEDVRNNSWACQLKIDLITDSIIAIHIAYRATVRKLLANLGQRINESPTMTLHKVQTPVMEAGTSPRIEPQSGVYKTTITFNLDVSIQQNAWALLDA